MPTLRLLLLGTPRLEKDEAPFKLSRRKAFALLAYLAIQGGDHAREALAALLWPESDTQQAYSYLRRELAVVNKELGKGRLRSDRESVGLIGGDELWLDVDHFRRLLTACGTHGHEPNEVCPECMPLLSDAVALYRDDFMTGFSLPDSPDFDDWQRFECESLRHELSGALKKLVYGHIAQDELEAAIYYARHWLSIDPWHEPAHRQLMQLYAWTGDRAAALRQYQECVRVLEEELSQPPEEATRELYEAIQSQQVSEPPTWTPFQPEQAEREERQISVDFPDVVPRHNLPVEVTPFFDREQELTEIRHLLLDKPGCRLLTLVGPGGIGKTRLAVQVAMQALQAFPHGIYLVPLAPIDSADLLVPTIADALRLPFRGRADPRVQLLNYLREKEMLLVLDNFEQMVDGASLLVDMLYAAPSIRLLVTSRERLNLREEWVREIGGLAYPIEEEMKSAEAGVALEDYPAVSLFLENARRTHPSYDLSEATQPAVVRICQLVEGMPLSLELASAWVSVMPTWEIAQEIDRNLDILSTSLRNVPKRHRSVRALFEHSYQLLTEEEQRVIKGLSVFRGGFKREAAEHVAGASLPLLVGLVNKSMLRGDPSGRYDQHELLREFLMDKLEEVPMEKENAQDRQCSYFAAFLQAREPYLRGSGQDEALAEIGAEIDNVRAAWRWAVARHKVPELSQSLESLYLFYDARSWVQEGEEVFRMAADSSRERAEGAPAPELLTLAQLLGRQGRFTYRLGRYREARELIEEGLQILDGLEAGGHLDARGEKAFSLRNLGSIMRGDGDYQRAQQLYEESLILFRESGDDLGTAGVLKQLGILAGSLGEYREAQRLLREAHGLYQALGDQYGVANILNDLGIVADRTGQYAEAQQLYLECLAIRRRIGHRWGVGTTLNNLGYLAFAQGQYTEAKELLEESLAIQREIGDRYHIANCLSNLGATVREQGDYDLARGYFSEALTSASEIGAVPLVLELLDGVARLMAASQPGKEELVAQLFAVVLGHPASDKPTKDGAERGLAGLAAQLTPDAIVTAQERAKEVELENLVAEVLEEIG